MADFIEFAVSAEGQQAMGTEAIPVRKDPSEFISSGDPGFRAVYEDFMMGLKANSVSEDGILSEIFMILRPEIENYLNTRDEDPNAVARRIQQKVQEYLDGLE